jgi:hypothetical protein
MRPNKSSRRLFCAFVIWALSIAGAVPASANPADFLLVNGKIVTARCRGFGERGAAGLVTRLIFDGFPVSWDIHRSRAQGRSRLGWQVGVKPVASSSTRKRQGLNNERIQGT